MKLRSAIGPALGMVLAALPIRSLLSLAAGAVLAGVAWWVLQPEGWLVEHVIFEGRQRASSHELRHLADLPNGTAIWQVDPERVTRAVERHPWVRTATTRISWPNTVIVQVEEHTPTAILHMQDKLVYVDEYGEPFLGVQPDDLDYVHLVGFEPGLSRLHPELGRIAIRNALWLVDALDERGLVTKDLVSSVSFSRTAGMTVAAGPARLLFGNSGLPTQLDRLALLVAGGLRLDEPVRVDLAPPTVAIVQRISSSERGQGLVAPAPASRASLPGPSLSRPLQGG